ncbi:MAG: sulfite exporter TauE/SafE family protein [Desulfovibrio sp.]|nr:sulfite exporter TauE/SafE family protein [Desulfovibrio sp.]MCA1986140.1 sulfite exporter TauE/SafE family protein [Desulfovibrio sp.]
MLFPVSGIEVSPFVPPLVACVISFFTSMGGVSGAFLLLPFQVSVLGYTSPSVSSTNQLYNIVAIPSGVLRYIREGRMVWPLTWIVVAGTLPGVLLGAIIRVKYLPDPGRFKLFAALVLLYIGGRMLRDLLKAKAPGQTKNSSEARFQALVQAHRTRQAEAGRQGGTVLPVACVKHFTLKSICYEFYGEVHTAPTLGILVLSAIVGIVGGVYGIGGGAIIAPFFVSFYRLPVYTVAGAALMGTFVTSVAGVAFYQLIAPLYPTMSVAPDWKLGILFGLGGMVGMYLGALCQKYVPAKYIKWMLSGLILFLAVKYLAEATY